MNKLAIAIAAFSLSAGAAFAENPYVSRTDVIQSGPNAGSAIVDQATTASVSGEAAAMGKTHHTVAQNVAPINQRVLSGR
ncbi:MAG: hypothetical protein QHC90_11900 [Shinella sp.]|nr:hypothetical protein [Shinella sp.]